MKKCRTRITLDRSRKKDRSIPNKSSIQAVTASDINFVWKMKEENKYKAREFCE